MKAQVVKNAGQAVPDEKQVAMRIEQLGQAKVGTTARSVAPTFAWPSRGIC